jgi:transcriptional regulator with XRE-family HTH domain
MGVIDFIKGQVKSHGLTLSELSKRTDIDPAYLSRILNKHISPSADIIDLLLGAVNINVEMIMQKNHATVEIIGEVQSLDGIFVEKKARIVNMTPKETTFLVLVTAPPLIKGMDFPSGFFLAFSKKAKIKDGDNAFIVYKEGNKIKKVVRNVRFQGTKAILSSIAPKVFDIVIPRKNIVEAHKMIRMLKLY